MDKGEYARLLRYARQQTRAVCEDDDLLQNALLVALQAGRIDMVRAENRRWLRGVLRKLGRHEARSAARRRSRDSVYALGAIRASSITPAEPTEFAERLSPALRATALLILTGHSKAEICWLMGLSDVALRKRVSDIRQRVRHLGMGGLAASGGLQGDLPFGLLRRALLRVVQAAGPALGTHDPDGHLLVLTSQKPGAWQPRASSI